MLYPILDLHTGNLGSDAIVRKFETLCVDLAGKTNICWCTLVASVPAATGDEVQS